MRVVQARGVTDRAPVETLVQSKVKQFDGDKRHIIPTHSLCLQDRRRAVKAVRWWHVYLLVDNVL